nr:retrovirus-related Pol polyprotein from transposon TNT 1-94 [Tanacetum cinerariifolium]
LLVQIYVDDIIFGATNKDLCKSFEKLMKDKFHMSLMGAEMDKDDVVVLMDDKEKDKKVEEAKVDKTAQVQGKQAESQDEIYKIDMDHANKVLSMQEDET